MNIWYGSNENKELSNLYERPFIIGSKNYKSVEHAYQTWKSGKFDLITYAKYFKAKRGIKIVGKYKCNNSINKFIMAKLILESFRQNTKAKELLLSTGDAKFTHNQDRGIWRYEFPKILERVRTILKRRNK